MSKVYNINDNQNILLQKQLKKPDNLDNNLFQKTFAQILGQNDPLSFTDKNSVNSNTLGEIKPLMFQKIGALPSLESVTSKTYQLLDLLENYSKDLGNASKSLKDLEPTINAIQESAKNLHNVSDNLKDEPNLSRIALECIQAANTEYIKFQRGDYV